MISIVSFREFIEFRSLHWTRIRGRFMGPDEGDFDRGSWRGTQSK